MLNVGDRVQLSGYGRDEMRYKYGDLAPRLLGLLEVTATRTLHGEPEIETEETTWLTQRAFTKIYDRFEFPGSLDNDSRPFCMR